MILSVAGVILSAAAAAATVEPRIVNGSPTQEEAATGALLSRSGATLRASCSGVLVGCRTFLTAAHCVCPGDTFCVPSANQYAVYLQHGGIFDVEAVVVHPQYEFGFRNDVAVVRLAAPVSGIEPARINLAGTPAPGTAGTIVGFGTSRATSDDAGLKRRGAVVLSSCSESSFPVPEPAHICWAFETPLGAEGENANTCFGDSGGPLFVGAGTGTAEVFVAGLASGGASSSCMPPDVAFDTNVFENRLFIAGAAGGDVGASNCGSLPPVGSPLTNVVAAGSAVLTKATAACRKEVGSHAWRHMAAASKAWQSCLDGVAAGRRLGPCPDAALEAALDKARHKIDPVKLEHRCAASVIAASLLGGGCAGAGDATALKACVIESGESIAAALLAATYGNIAVAQALPSGEARCQKAVGKNVMKYAQMRLKALGSCRTKADRARVAACPDARTTARIERSAATVERGIAKSCSAAQLAALGASGGTVPECDWNAGATSLAACLVARADALTDALAALVVEVQAGPRGHVEVVPGTLLLRATLNGVDPAFGSLHDLDLYLRFGAAASRTEHDAVANGIGVFEAIELVAPAAGIWHFFVDEVAGRRVPHQLTITSYGP